MKKIITIIYVLALLLTYTKTSAQVTNGSNIANSGPEFVGWDGTTTNIKDLDLKNYFAGRAIRFYTWSTASTNAIPERMVITDDGKVGIGTSAPSYKLDIKDGAGNCNMRLQAQTSGSANIVLSRYSAGDNCAVNYKTGTGDVWFTGAFSDDNYRIKDASNVTQLLIDQTTGFVGLGTTSPSTKLHVNRSVTTGSYASIAIVDFASTSTGLVNGNGLYLTSNVSSASGYHAGFNSNVNGGNICYGYLASVDNTNTPTSSNYGFFSALNCRSATTGNSSNTGFGTYLQVFGSATSNSGFVSNIGNSTSPNAVAKYGGYFSVLNAITNVGLYAEAFPTNGSGSASSCYGVQTIAGTYSSNVPYNAYGGYFRAVGASNNNYGVYASGGTTCTTSPTLTNCPNAAGYFSGDVGVTNSLYQSSDLILKDNIQPIMNSVSLINQLNPVSYNYKTQQYASLHLSDGNHYGLIAEELKPILPDLVRGFSEPEVKDSLGNIINPQVDFQAINYTALIPILIAAIKEQQVQIDNLQLSQKTINPSPTNQLEIKLSDRNTIILDQNQPNPFKENTTIKYNIPDNVKSAQVLFYNSKGNVINTVEINTKGEGSLLVYGSDLSSGIYTYSLLVDGKVIETKKMIKL